MNKELKDITITVCATQDTVESDSFNNTYDANATYPVVNVTELKEALSNGGVVAVTEDIQTNNIEDTAAARIVISQPTTLNLEKKIITPDNMGNNNTNFCALIIDADTTINAGKDGGIDTGVNGGYGVNVRKGAAVTINDGYYYGGGTAVQVQKGTLIINGGTFACEPFGDPYGYNFLINCVDSAYKNGTAKVIIQGGTFINFAPSNNSAEGAGSPPPAPGAAEKYLGFPYVWGGSSPSTSFDCSGFVSYVYNQCGWSFGRLGAQGLYNICSRTSSPRPGDLVFFVGTYDTAGISHVGIYVGDGWMLHCGDPISYANLNSSYWQSHLYAYGRLP